jgi:hypothetical protein
VDLDKYIKSMAENCSRVYREMAGKTALGYKIDKLEPPFAMARFKAAIVIPYENQTQRFEVRFVLGLNAEYHHQFGGNL